MERTTVVYVCATCLIIGLIIGLVCGINIGIVQTR